MTAARMIAAKQVEHHPIYLSVAAHDSHRAAMMATKSRVKNPTQYDTLARQPPNSSARSAWTSRTTPCI